MCGPTSSETSILEEVSWRDAFVSASFRQGSSTPQAWTGTAVVSPCTAKATGQAVKRRQISSSEPTPTAASGEMPRTVRRRISMPSATRRRASSSSSAACGSPSSASPRNASRASPAAVISCPAWSCRSRAMRARSASSAMRAIRTLAESSSSFRLSRSKRSLRSWSASPRASQELAAPEVDRQPRERRRGHGGRDGQGPGAQEEERDESPGGRRGAGPPGRSRRPGARRRMRRRARMPRRSRRRQPGPRGSSMPGRGNLHRARPSVARTRIRIRPISLIGAASQSPQSRSTPRSLQRRAIVPGVILWRSTPTPSGV